MFEEVTSLIYFIKAVTLCNTINLQILLNLYKCPSLSTELRSAAAQAKPEVLKQTTQSSEIQCNKASCQS